FFGGWLMLKACKRIGLLGFLGSLALVGCGGAADVQSEAEPAQSLAQRAGAPLFEGMGDYHMPITTADPDAQRYFDQGMVLAFGFNHAESIRSFRAAQTLDPTCAMCFWGEALATGPNINVTSNGKAIMSPAERTDARAAIDQALALTDGVTPKERDWIQALDQRYDGQADTPRDPLDRAWADALAEMAARYPDDTTVASVYAEALMNTMPWDYWGPNGEAKPDTQAVIASLEAVMEADPGHPLALHLYIHALEASSNAAKAEAAADRLANLVPGSGHLVHMPSHIYFRVGRYQDSALANIRAAEVDEAYIAQCNAQGFYPALYYPHNIHFLWASATMQGQSALSLDSARRVVANVRVEQVEQFPTIQFFRTVPMLSLVRFAKWEEILAEPEPYEPFAFARAIWHYGRGVAHAALGDAEAALIELAAIEALEPQVDEIFMGNVYPARDLLEIAKSLLRGEMAYRDGDAANAVLAFEEAVTLQDALPYTEPPFWYYPTRQSLGAALLASDRVAEAQAIFEADLEQYPMNGWSMFGLAEALRRQGDEAGAEQITARFETVWQFADVELMTSIL
ncbi:MAG: tetratricopeptide repeat protein, partial [Luminiphilus sp.]